MDLRTPMHEDQEAALRRYVSSGRGVSLAELCSRAFAGSLIDPVGYVDCFWDEV